MRAFNALLDQWELISVNEGKGLRDFGTDRRDGGEMHIEQTFAAMTPNPFGEFGTTTSGISGRRVPPRSGLSMKRVFVA